MHTAAIAKPPATLSPANLDPNLVNEEGGEGSLGNYELEDDD
jgi:hypothetical protein